MLKSLLSLIGSALVASSTMAAPMIEFDTKTFSCGNVPEGKTEKLSAQFKVKNSGNETLRITSVRPGCGCTVVSYDSIVEPGKTVTISATVNIKGQSSGHVSKAVSVTSNAQNEPSAKLTIEATVIPIIDVSENTIALAGGQKPLYLSSKKKDLKITEASFKSSAQNSTAPTWQNDLSTPLTFTFSATDSVRKDGYKVFRLELKAPKDSKPQQGEFLIKTNHEEKPLITIRGSL